MRFMFALAFAFVGIAFAAQPATAAPGRATLNAAYNHGCFDVYYRECAHDHWQYYGSYDCLPEARQAAHCLARQGYQISIRHHH